MPSFSAKLCFLLYLIVISQSIVVTQHIEKADSIKEKRDALLRPAPVKNTQQYYSAYDYCVRTCMYGKHTGVEGWG